MGDGRLTTSKFQAAPSHEAQASMFQRRPFAGSVALQEPETAEPESPTSPSSVPATAPINIPLFAPPPSVQRAEEPTLEDDEQEEMPLQAKLTIGAPGDKYEQEADATAATVMAMPQAKGLEDDEPDTLQQRPTISPLLQRQAMAGEEKLNKDNSLTQLKPLVQAKGAARGAPQGFEQRLNRHRGGGQPLSKETKAFMEPRFGADFGGVRVHEAPKEASDIGAQAFTHGQDIYFNSGKYNPGSSSGKELLAHELTHTIQQTGGIQARSGSLTAKPNKLQAKLTIVAAPPTLQRREDGAAGVALAPTLPAPAEGEGSPAAASPKETDKDKKPAQPVAKTQGNASGKSPPGDSGGTSAIGTSGAGGGASSPTSPESDPGFQAVAARGKGVAKDQQQHEPAETEAQEAQDAAKSPANEVDSQAQDQQVDEMEQQQPGEFDPGAFKAAIFEKLKEITPKTEEEAHQFKESNEVDKVRDSVSKRVGDEQDQAAAPIKEKAEEDPDTSGIEPRQEAFMVAPDPGSIPGVIGAEQATPKPKDDATVSAPLEANSQELDQQMAAENVTEEQLANSNEPAFQEALGEKQKAQADAAEAPAGYREQEAATLGLAQTEAQATAATQIDGMHADRQGAMSQVDSLQGHTKGEDEHKRKEIADHINGIYERVKTDVDHSLSSLEQDVIGRFDQAANRAKQKFEDYVDRKLLHYRLERYGTNGIVGIGLLIYDQFAGLPEEVNIFFQEGRQIYLDEMDVALDGIANLVSDRLTQAKQKISAGRQEIKNYVASLPEDLQSIGQEAAKSIQSKFDALEQQVHDKYDELVNTLAEKYRNSLQTVDDRIEEIKAQNRGLINRAKDLIGGVLNTIGEIKAMLASVLAGAQDVINQIIQDPISFLSKLIEGLKQGFQNFAGNIVEHLQSGLVGWLTGALGSIGIQISPDIFSLKGIFTLTTQVLGLTWNYIRSKAVKMFGEPVVGAMEKSVELFQVMKNDGVGGLWEELKGQFGDLKESVMGQIQNMLSMQVIQSGITWILSLLNPASAFVRAAKMIVDIVMFFINRGSQVMTLVQTVIESISAIASGSVGAVAKAIEGTLVKSLPVVIGFLASLLGLGGLADKVQKIFEGIRKRVDDAIEWVLEKVRKLFKGNSENNTQDGDHPSQYVEGDEIRTEYRKDIRALFYPNSYRKETKKWKMDRLKELTNPQDSSEFKDEMKDQWELKGANNENVTIDHKPRVVEHWNSDGNDMNQTGRADYYNDVRNLTLVSRKNNSSDGANAMHAGLRYEPRVGSNFRGPKE